METVRGILRELLGTSIWEVLAVVLSVAYLVLATRRSLWCWLCALISTLIYGVLMLRTGLVMDTLLQGYYLVMAVYGFIEWRRGREPSGELTVISWNWQQHLMAIGATLFATVINAWILQFIEMARSPWLDSFVTWGSVLCTWMVARRVIENWLYWIVVDGIAAYLYYSRGLTATAGLMVLYVGMVIHGYFIWRQQRTTQRTAEVAA